ncbi:macro domain-containing protein [Bifidobacterium felsineum]|uniref:macro domain-containing protein n=1 Tax=Bifidobacterium felsineum TaxID=2045440 RepID=UPI001BDD5518|nr:macro domain-containing protein [Bifidobacterium felsineum]MBT1163063.1 macro domain-containing protein [Bifidobacterium felsineum]
MPLQLVRQDITKMQVDAIVNAANTRLIMGGGVCGAIFHAAGASRLQEACDRLSPIHTGDAVATPGFDLPAQYVIHTAGPVWQGGDHGEERLLRACYSNSLQLASELGCASIAFPLISSGIFGYPKVAALHVAIDEIRGFLEQSADDLDVYLCVFDRAAFDAGTELDRQIQSYIDDHYVVEHKGQPSSRAQEMRELGYPSVSAEQEYSAEEWSAQPPRAMSASAPVAHQASATPASSRSESLSYLDDEILADLDEPFDVILMRIIDAKGYSDVEVYKRANISRKLFSKIRCGNGYMPSKKTVLALAIALRLNIDETEDLLACAGYAFSHSMKFDVIVEFFITHGIFDVFTINESLFRYDQPLLGQ